jgi:hypothetical protein
MNIFSRLATFLQLRDTPSTYSGQGGKILKVNSGANAIEFSDPGTPSAHASTHTNGTDDIQSATAGQKGLMTSTYASKLDGIEANADVTDATNVNAAGAVMESDYNAQTILAATSDDTPAALVVGEQTIVGRITGGNIAALTAAQVRTLLGTLDGRSQTITCADNVTLDWSAGSSAIMTFDRNAVAMTFSNPVAGQVYRLVVIQGDGSDVITWSTVIKWVGGVVPTLTTAAGAIDIITFFYMGTTWYGSASLAFAAVA